MGLYVKSSVTDNTCKFDECRVTTDNKYVEKHLYDIALFFHRKCLLSLEEVETYLKLNSRLRTNLTTMTHKIRNYSYGIDRGQVSCVKEVRKVEEDIAVNEYKKIAVTLTMQEQIDILERLLNTNYIEWLRDASGQSPRDHDINDRGPVTEFTYEKQVFLKNKRVGEELMW